MTASVLPFRYHVWIAYALTVQYPEGIALPQVRALSEDSAHEKALRVAEEIHREDLMGVSVFLLKTWKGE